MSTINTDAHALESAHTWDYMDEGEREMRPQKILDQNARTLYNL